MAGPGGGGLSLRVAIKGTELEQVTIAADQTAFTADLDAVTFTLTRTGSTAAALTADVLLTQDQEFLQSEDLTQSVTFDSGESTAALVLEPQFFVGHEVTMNGTLTATVQEGTGYVLGTEKAASTSILVTSPAVTVRLEESSYTFDEGDDSPVVTLVATTVSGVPSPNQSFYVSMSASEWEGYTIPTDYDTPFGSTAVDPAVRLQRRRRGLHRPRGGAADAGGRRPGRARRVLHRERCNWSPATPTVVGLRQHDGTACEAVTGFCSVTATITDDDPIRRR